MSREEYKRYFDVLELHLDASILEIRSSYLRLKKLYSTESMAISPIEDEFPEKRREEILEQIEEAYTRLMELFKAEQNRTLHYEKSNLSDNVQKEKERLFSYSGQVLKQIREKMEIELFDVALDTKIRIELLQNIELEKFDSLPQEVYLKGHISNYANYLLLDPKKVADDYLKRYKAWRNSIKPKE